MAQKLFMGSEDGMMTSKKLSATDFVKWLGNHKFDKFTEDLGKRAEGEGKWYLRKIVNPLPNEDDTLYGCVFTTGIIVIKVKDDYEHRATHHAPRLGIKEQEWLEYTDKEAHSAPPLVDLEGSHVWMEVEGHDKVYVLQPRAVKRAAEDDDAPPGKRRRTGSPGAAAAAPASATGSSFGDGAATGFDFSGATAFKAEVKEEDDPTWPLLPDEHFAEEKRTELDAGFMIQYDHEIAGRGKPVKFRPNDKEFHKKKAPQKRKYVHDAFENWAVRQQPEFAKIREEFEAANVHALEEDEAKKVIKEAERKKAELAAGEATKALLAEVKEEEGKAYTKLTEISGNFHNHELEQRKFITAINAAVKAGVQLRRSDVNISLYYPDTIRGKLMPSRKISQLGTADHCHPPPVVKINPLTNLPMPGAC
eukprot:Hpha_TRINITY_DN15011_c4_g3::TRINITY_DN15011_c4_g3_i2::g.126423::m.126423